MSRLLAATLCDFAQVRESLLFVNSAGITRLHRPYFPAPLGAMLAVVVELEPDELTMAHELSVTVKHVDSAVMVARVVCAFGFQVRPPGLEPGEASQVPMVIDLRPVALTEAGEHDIQVSVDSAPATLLTLWAKLLPGTLGI